MKFVGLFVGLLVGVAAEQPACLANEEVSFMQIKKGQGFRDGALVQVTGGGTCPSCGTYCNTCPSSAIYASCKDQCGCHCNKDDDDEGGFVQKDDQATCTNHCEYYCKYEEAPNGISDEDCEAECECGKHRDHNDGP